VIFIYYELFYSDIPLTVTWFDELVVVQIVYVSYFAFLPSLNAASFGIGEKSILLPAGGSACVA
jgi:hypothetical protein